MKIKAATLILLCFLWACFRADSAEITAPPLSLTNVADLDLETLMEVKVDSVFGASRYEQKITRAPASVSIVTSDDIKRHGYRTLAEALRSVRGMYVSNDRNYSYFGMRGFLRPGDYNTRLLLLIDGHRMNDNTYDAGLNTDPIDIDLIDRVEVIRGPSSSIYGNSAFFGVINIVTKKGRQFDGPEISTEVGDFGAYKGRFSYGKRFENEIEFLLSGSYMTREGDSHLYFPEFDQRISTDPGARNNGFADNADGEEFYNLFSSLSGYGLTLSALFYGRTKEVPTASFGTLFNSGREKTADYRTYVDLKYDRVLNENIEMSGRAFYDVYPYYATYPYDYGSPGSPFLVDNKDEAYGEWIGTEWQFNANILDRHTLIWGIEYRENLQQHQLNYDSSPFVSYLDDNQNTRNLGLYAQAEIEIVTNVLLNAGVRYDHYFESFGGTLNPRAGLIYTPWKNGTFKFLYGEAFRAPNAYERFYFAAQKLLPNLQPETIRTYEIAYEQYLNSVYRLNVSGYYYNVEDLITQTASPGKLGFAFANLDEAEAKGIEFEVEGKYDSGLQARLSYALQRAEDKVSGSELSNSPRHLANLNVSIPLYRDKIFAGLELQYHASVKTLNGNRADNFLIANLTLFSRELVKNLEISASVYNLFDTKYGYPGAEDHLQDIIMQDGRSFRFKLTYKF